MPGKLFLPAAGERASGDGSLHNLGNLGHYWSSMHYDSGIGYILRLHNSASEPSFPWFKGLGFSVRCVR